MTISAVVPDIAFTGSGGAGTMGPFSLIKSGTPIVFYANSDIVVYRYDTVTDTTPTLLVEGTHYTLTGGPTAGSITLTAPSTGLLTAERLYVVRRQALAQSLDLVNGGNFSSSNLERRLDIIEAKFQEQARDIKSAVRFAMFDTDEIPGTVPLARAIDRLPYISGTASNPILEFINVNELGATANLTESQLADIAVVVADLTGADTIGIVAEAFDTIGVEALQDVAENIGEVELVADALADGGLSVTKDTYAALTAIPAASRSDDMTVFVAGRAAVGDDAQGFWMFDASSVATADGATILAPDAGTGKYLRLHSRPEVLMDWLCTGNGVADDKDEILTLMAAAAAGNKPLIGDWNKVYAVSGNVAVPASYLQWRNTRLKQLTPESSTSLRTISSISKSGHRWSRIQIDINGDGDYGSIEDYRGFDLQGGDDHIFEDLEVFGDNKMSAIYLATAVDSSLIRPWVHDCDYLLGADPGDDVINGIRINGGSGIRIESPLVTDLKGNFGTGVKRRYTRGIIMQGGTEGLVIDKARVARCDQGIDFSGSDASIGGGVFNSIVTDVNSHGIKLANSPKHLKVMGNTIIRPGLTGIVVSGSTDSGMYPEDVQVIGNSVRGMDPDSTFIAAASRAYFAVYDGGAGDPREITFRDNHGMTPSGGTAPPYGFFNDVAPTTTIGAILFEGGSLRDWTTSKYGGGRAGPLIAIGTLSGSQAIVTATQTVIAFDTETDVHGMHAAGVFTAYLDGFYSYEAVAQWNNTAGTTTRQLILRKNGTNTAQRMLMPSSTITTGQTCNIAGEIQLVKGDTLSFAVLHDHGSNVDLISALTTARVAYSRAA